MNLSFAFWNYSFSDGPDWDEEEVEKEREAWRVRESRWWLDQEIEDNGYECDVKMQECLVLYSPDMNIYEPDVSECNTWVWLMGCAREHQEHGCLPPWSTLCQEFSALAPPTGAGPQC